MRRQWIWALGASVVVHCGGLLEAPPTIASDGTSYNSIQATSAWSPIDVWKVLGQGTNVSLEGFNGATFDGRYVYLAPQAGGLVHRIDTTMQFSSADAWETFDTHVGENPPDSVSFAGAVFDGRFVYLAPYQGGVFRYDTRASFVAPSSWSTFDVSAFGEKTFSGMVFDGRYIFFIPLGGIAPYVFLRFDTQGAFDATTSWSTFDATSTLGANSGDFAEGAFDGRYVYAAGVRLARYDTQSEFASGSSWTFFTPPFNGAHLKRGVVFDGHYLYFGTGPNAVALRYDPSMPFASAPSWTSIDLRSLVPATWELVDILPANFDGRFVYLTAETLHPEPSDPSTFIVQCDTQTPIVSAASCTSFDATTTFKPLVTDTTHDLYTSVFDGRNMYFASGSFSMIARFDVKAPPSMPSLPAFHGSFF